MRTSNLSYLIASGSHQNKEASLLGDVLNLDLVSWKYVPTIEFLIKGLLHESFLLISYSEQKI